MCSRLNCFQQLAARVRSRVNLRQRFVGTVSPQKCNSVRRFVTQRVADNWATGETRTVVRPCARAVPIVRIYRTGGDVAGHIPVHGGIKMPLVVHEYVIVPPVGNVSFVRSP